MSTGPIPRTREQLQENLRWRHQLSGAEEDFVRTALAYLDRDRAYEYEIAALRASWKSDLERAERMVVKLTIAEAEIAALKANLAVRIDALTTAQDTPYGHGWNGALAFVRHSLTAATPPAPEPSKPGTNCYLLGSDKPDACCRPEVKPGPCETCMGNRYLRWGSDEINCPTCNDHGTGKKEEDL